MLSCMQVGFSKEGIVNGISLNVYGNAGISPNDNSNDPILNHIDNGKLIIMTNNYNFYNGASTL